MPEDEEKLQLRADVDRLKKMVHQKDEMIEEMEHELNNKAPVSDWKAEAREKQLNEQIRDLQVEIDGKDVTIQEQQGLIGELRVEIDRLEKSNRELANRSILPESDDSCSFDESGLIKASEECEKLRQNVVTLQEHNMELQKELIEKKEEHEGAVEHVRNLESHMKTQYEEIARLEGEVFDMKNSANGKHASCGNSIFAEAMEAERQLEEDLKKLFREKQALTSMVKRLTLEKEEAEERARAYMNRGLIVRNAINHIDVEEMRRLRARVHELETERTHLWERLFIKMKSVPKREIGAIIVGYFESFKCSIASITGGQSELLKRNEQYVTTIRGLQQEVENQRVKIEQLQFDVECAERKMRSAVTSNSEGEIPQLRAPLKSIDNSRPSFFVKPKKKEPAPPPSLELSMANMEMTPQKPSLVTNRSSTAKKEETSEWAARHLKARADKKATPAPRYNFVELKQPVPKFKAAVLQMPSSPTERKEN